MPERVLWLAATAVIFVMNLSVPGIVISLLALGRNPAPQAHG